MKIEGVRLGSDVAGSGYDLVWLIINYSIMSFNRISLIKSLDQLYHDK
jgi:hypothetical protein